MPKARRRNLNPRGRIAFLLFIAFSTGGISNQAASARAPHAPAGDSHQSLGALPIDAEGKTPTVPQSRDSAKSDETVVRTAAQADTPASALKSRTGQTAGASAITQLSDAEKIALLRRLIQSNRKELEELKARRESHRESQDAQKTFEDLDHKLKAKQDALKDAQQKGNAKDVESLTKDIEQLKKPWQLAQDRFNLELRERKAVSERIEILEGTLKNDEDRIKVLLGTKVEAKAAEKGEPAKKAEPAKAAEPAKREEPAGSPVMPKAPEPTGAASKTGEEKIKAAAPTAPALPALPGTVPARSEPAATEKPAETEKKPPSKELIKAEEQVKQRSEVVSEIEQREERLVKRLQDVERSIKLETELLETANLKAKNARESRDLFNQQIAEKTKKGAGPAELAALRDQIEEADQRLQDSLEEVHKRESRLEELHEEQNLATDALHVIRQKTSAAKSELEKAQKQVEKIQNPLALPNVLRWIVDRGPIILGTLLGMVLLNWLMGKLSHRLVKLVAVRGMRGSKAERENRAKTLVGVFQNTVTVAIIIGGSLMILDEAGLPIGPLLGGAAVFGLAVAFGAQNLIRDYFYGFMILFENQFKLNDVVRIGEHSGQVEQITLRMTALRDEEGNLHFLPNGAITSVVNLTHGWSRALFTIGVAYKEDPDRVIAAVVELGKEIRKDPAYKLMILEDLNMLGVDALAESAVLIKFSIKTLPLQQWAVKREFLRRLKKRFDELSIEIPYPQRTLTHRVDDPSVFWAQGRSVRDGREADHSSN